MSSFGAFFEGTTSNWESTDQRHRVTNCFFRFLKQIAASSPKSVQNEKHLRRFRIILCSMAHAELERPEGTAEDWTIDQAWESYTSAEHAMWDHLFARQAQMLPDRVVPEFMAGLDILRMTKPGIPHFGELS